MANRTFWLFLFAQLLLLNCGVSGQASDSDLPLSNHHYTLARRVLTANVYNSARQHSSVDFQPVPTRRLSESVYWVAKVHTAFAAAIPEPVYSLPQGVGAAHGRRLIDSAFTMTEQPDFGLPSSVYAAAAAASVAGANRARAARRTAAVVEPPRMHQHATPHPIVKPSKAVYGVSRRCLQAATVFESPLAAAGYDAVHAHHRRLSEVVYSAPSVEYAAAAQAYYGNGAGQSSDYSRPLVPYNEPASAAYPNMASNVSAPNSGNLLSNNDGSSSASDSAVVGGGSGSGSALPPALLAFYAGIGVLGGLFLALVAAVWRRNQLAAKAAVEAPRPMDPERLTLASPPKKPGVSPKKKRGHSPAKKPSRK